MPQALLARLLAAFGTAAVLLAVGAFGGCHYKQSQWDAATAKQGKQAQKQIAQQSADSPKVEIRYVDRIKEIKVPVVQIRDRLVASCTGGLHNAGPADGGASAGARAAEPADGAAPADAGDGLLGAVADEIPKCVANGIQLDELQSLICANADQTLVKKLRGAGKLQCR